MKTRSILVLTCFVLAPTVNASFSDITINTPHYEAINYVHDQGIVDGYSDHTFRGDQTINRVELLKILIEAKYENLAACKRLYNYTDIDTNAWYAPYLQKASCLNIVQGDPSGTFRPADPVNAAEAFKIISETFGLNAEISSSDWYEGYTKALISKGAIPTDIESISSSINRGQVAEIIYRLQTNNQSLSSPTYEQLDQHIFTETTPQLNPYCSDIACNEVEITTDDSYRYITSNGIPNHETGRFPSRGNPNAILEQTHSYRLPLSPVKTNTSTDVRIAGVALNGVPFEPNTAETYDANDDWAIEAFDANGIGGLGMDASNAHVQPNGTYHYHGVPEGLEENSIYDHSSDLVQMGWAADGFPIYYSPSNHYQSSWQVKAGSRPDGGPEGNYDGTYTQDFEFIQGSGDLDSCNGITLNGQYKYLITNTFPYVQRCVYGTPDPSFDRKLQDNRGLPGTRNQLQESPSDTSETKTPPQAAITACEGLETNTSCEIDAPRGTVEGTCRNTQDGSLACVPQ